MNPQNNLHNNFRLNGKHFKNTAALLSYAESKSSEMFSFLSDWFDTSSVISVYTSGSTGNPNRIELKKQHMINSARATGAFFALPAGTSALLCLSLNFIAGKMMLVRAMTLGWHIDVVEPSSNPLEKLEKQYDFGAMVPLQLEKSLHQLHKVKKLIVGGSAVAKKLFKELQKLSTEIYATYGMTETITHIAVKRLNGIEKDPLTHCESLLYKTLPNIKITKDGRGCLVIEAPEIADDQIVTNDMVQIISDTEFVWLGRFDTVVNSGGIKLIPEQIEKKLLSIINERFFVAGVPDESLGEKLVLIVEGSDQSKVILNKLKKLTGLKRYEKPKDVYFIPKFIETKTKKIQRQKTLDLLFKK